MFMLDGSNNPEKQHEENVVFVKNPNSWFENERNSNYFWTHNDIFFRTHLKKDIVRLHFFFYIKQPAKIEI